VTLDSSIQHTEILTDNVLSSVAIAGNYLNDKKPILFRGIGLSHDKESVLKVEVLFGNPTTYSANPAKQVTELPEGGHATPVLVGAVQGRNNARIVVSGSVDMFSNAFFFQTDVSTGNKVFCTELSKWVFAETGVLRFRDIVHHKVDGTPPDVILHEKERPDLPISLYPDPEITRNSLVYRIKDTIVYSMVVEQFTEGRWTPFAADDMQMEFVMLDPYVRKTMTSDKRTGLHRVEFVAPDSYGVFKFRVLYRRVGYSVLHAETQVSIRPFKHNEYERFIFSAYPYYTSALSATIAFFIFSLFFIFSSDSK
jgi:oligosaccharyltransferase complex subunit beta